MRIVQAVTHSVTTSTRRLVTVIRVVGVTLDQIKNLIGLKQPTHPHHQR